MQLNHDEPHAISEYVIYHLCYGNYDQALALINEYICISRNHRAIMEQLELKNIILRLRIQNNPSMSIGPTTMSNALPRSFTYEMLDVVQKILRCSNHYEVLRVSHDATFSEVKRAYKRLALRLHPDKNHVPMAEDAFRKINAAADLLTDAQKRIDYDVHLMLNGLKPNSSSSFRVAGGADNIYQDSPDAERQTYFESAQGLEQMNWRRRKPYVPANQRVPQRETYYNPKQILYGLLLTVLLMFSTSYFMKTNQPYSFEETSLFAVRRVTHNFGVPYYVTSSFTDTKLVKDIAKLEKEIENAYIYDLRQKCLVEHARRESIIAHAKNTDNQRLKFEARKLSLPACNALSRLGEPRYKLLDNNNNKSRN